MFPNPVLLHCIPIVMHECTLDDTKTTSFKSGESVQAFISRTGLCSPKSRQVSNTVQILPVLLQLYSTAILQHEQLFIPNDKDIRHDG